MGIGRLGGLSSMRFYVPFEFTCALDDDGHEVEVVRLFSVSFVAACMA